MRKEELNNQLRQKIIKLLQNKSSRQNDPLLKTTVKEIYLNTKKLGPIYSMHRYWTKQPIEVIQANIEHFTDNNPDSVVLDCFCGSGTTGAAALLSGRKAILFDISPAAVFIASNYASYTDLNALDREYSKICLYMEEVQKEHYRTKCSKCGNTSNVVDSIYSGIYRCPACKSDNVFSEGNWEKIAKSKKRKKINCKNCSNEYSRDGAEYTGSKCIGLHYYCNHCVRKGSKLFKLLDSQDRKYLDSINKKTIDSGLWFPKDPIPDGHNVRQLYGAKIDTINKLFTRNTLEVLAKLWKRINQINDPDIKKKMIFLFTSIIFRVTKLYRLRVAGAGGVMSGTLYIPPLSQDFNVYRVLKERYRKIKKGFIELNKGIKDKENQVIVNVHSALDMSILPKNSIDYIYTDPPYGGNINYSELNFIWECWLKNFTEREEEIIINSVQGKNLETYSKMISGAFQEIYRVLKSNHFLSLVYHYSDPEVWGVLQESILNSGFVFYNSSRIHSKMTTAKQTLSERTARSFIILHFQKSASISPVLLSDSKDLERKIVNIIEDQIENYGPQSRPDLYDVVIMNLFNDIRIRDFDLDLILNRNFTKKEKKWKK